MHVYQNCSVHVIGAKIYRCKFLILINNIAIENIKNIFHNLWKCVFLQNKNNIRASLIYQIYLSSKVVKIDISAKIVNIKY